MSTDEKKMQDIIQHKSEEVHNLISRPDYFQSYLLETLKSFGFRYFDNAQGPEKLSQNVFRLWAVETGIKEAIKIKNDQLRAGIGELVKRVSKAEGPTIVRELRVELKNSGKTGEALISARISFGHPLHDFAKGTFVEKNTRLNYEDELQFRNTLARSLEEVCELF